MSTYEFMYIIGIFTLIKAKLKYLITIYSSTTQIHAQLPKISSLIVSKDSNHYIIIKLLFYKENIK